MKATITPGALNGEINAPASKSMAHRALICAALSDKATKLNCSDVCEDIAATVSCLNALGAEILASDSGFSVKPIVAANENVALDCRECGSTLRFMLPVAAAMGKGAKLYGCGRLAERPIAELCKALAEHGISFSADRLPFSISGTLSGGEFLIDGAVSSQYISGLLFALPLLSVDSAITVAGHTESKPYIEMTLSVLRSFGVKASVEGSIIVISGSEKYFSPSEYTVEGDWSNAAFFLAAAAINRCDVKLNNLTHDSAQGDRRIVEILNKFVPDTSNCFNIDVADIPDLLPVLAVTACFAKGKSVFFNAARLRLKESDRLASTAELISSLGGNAHANADSLTVFGSGSLSGGTVDACGDHRIAMAAAVAATACEGKTEILGCEAVNKSYPKFFDAFSALGGKVILN